MHLLAWIPALLQAQRGHLFAWSPIFLGIGIGVYFSLQQEPVVTLVRSVAGAAVLLAGFAWGVRGTAAALVLTATSLVGAGFGLAGWRAHDVAAPVLGWRYYGPVEGRVVGLDRSGSDAVRITLDQVKMAKLSPDRIPARVRISLHGVAADSVTPQPGARIMTTGHLSPPGGPVEPGGFDFQRHSWFLQLGAVGYTRVPVLIAAPPEVESLSMRIFAVRMALSNYVRAALPGNVGGFAAAVTSGDRSGMGQDALHDLRASNLAHLLAISGLHMGLLTGFVFAALRIGLAVIPFVALRWPTRRIAAFGALMAGAGYLALSGGNVATERAFIMAAVALCAVMLNRRAISLRSVAIAALIVLFLRPEAMLGPGFQMSFAATTALVAVFNAMRDAPWRMPRWLQSPAAVVIASGVSGLATAPVAAAHFNAVSHYGLFANVVSVPVMGTLVVPSAVLAVFLAPFGLASLGLTLMGWGLSWILWVANTTASLPGARSFVPGPDALVLPCITLGCLFLVLWQGRLRWAGLAPVGLAFFVWTQAERPDILISDTGGLVGIMTPEGRALSRERGSGFVAKNWLENDGDGQEQAVAYDRWTDAWNAQAKTVAEAQLASRSVLHITGKRAAAAPPDCRDAVLVSNQPVDLELKSCALFDPDALRHTGAVALRVTEDGGLEMTTARQLAGDRLWSSWPERGPDTTRQYVRMSPTSLP